MASYGGGSRASDEEIVGLMVELERLQVEATRAARDAEIAARRAVEARMSLALRAMSLTNEEERAKIFASGQALTVDRILNWAAREAELTSRIQRRKWGLFRETQN